MNSGPKYKDYEDQAKREKSFFNYPKPYPLKEDLVRAGFFYLGPGAGNDDDCQCYYCGVRLFNWTKEDDPLKEHEKFRPNCLVIQTLKNPLNIAPPIPMNIAPPIPMNKHPTENAKYPEIETKIQNSQVFLEPRPGTMTNSLFPKQNNHTVVSYPVSKEDLYPLPQNPLKSESIKRQHYPLRQYSQELETARTETTSTNPPQNYLHNYSSLHTTIQAPPTNQQFIGHTSCDNIPIPSANISSSYQPHDPGIVAIEQQEPTHRQYYYPPQTTFQVPQTITEPATYGHLRPPFQPYYGATDQFPYTVASFEQPSYGNTYDQVLSPRPILDQANMNSNIQITRFPPQLLPTSLGNQMPPQEQNYPQHPQYRK